jgi:hypothetical protein
MVTSGLDNSLVPRLSVTTAAQRGALQLMLHGIQLGGSPDRRSLPLNAMRTFNLYKLCVFGGVRDANFEFV